MISPNPRGAAMLGNPALPLVACLASIALAAPVEETLYGRACLRLENRPGPQSVRDAGSRRTLEQGFAKGGFQARWISVVDPLGCPVYPSQFIPCTDPQAAENERILQDWVTDIHAAGLPVVSWFPLVICKSGAAAHPEWRQQFLVPQPEGHCRDNTCCINSPYGEALIDFCNEAIERFGLDGFWFDGSAFTQIWDRPLPLSCTCPYCAAAFRQATGLELPTTVDWGSPGFRRWVAWRYDTFSGYIGRLAAGIRSKHPDAAVVVNHYHRPIIPWQGAIPLNPYPADIITGSEAGGADRVDTTMRLCRAYGRPQNEVWRPFDTPATDPAHAPETDALIHHALSCFVAGGMPSFGGGGEKTAETAAIMAPILNAIHPFVGGPSRKQVALHLSQQTETFYLSRDPKGVDWQIEPFWSTVEAWTQALGQVHLPPDYIYDKDLTPATLAAYQTLLLPVSLALSEAQVEAVLQFIRAGGTAVLGPAAGALDEWGEPRSDRRLARELGITFATVPDTRMGPRDVTRLLPVAAGSALTVQGFRTGLALQGDGWQVLYRDEEQPVVATQRVGLGRVMALATDLGGAPGSWQAVAGGDTSLAVTDRIAAGGAHALEFVDGPTAPQSFYPDMEAHFPAIAAADAAGGRLTLEVRVDADAEACIQLRNTALPTEGPHVSIGPGGKLTAGDRDLGTVPVGAWVKVEIAFRFGQAQPASFDLTVTPRGGAAVRHHNLPCTDASWARCNWMVIFGGGSKPATFHVDDIQVTPGVAGPGRPVFVDDFEATPVGGTQPESTCLPLIQSLKAHWRHPLEVESLPTVRAGYFERDGKVLVHLHNRLGTHSDVGQAVGPEALIVARFPVKGAKLARSGEDLVVQHDGGAWTIRLPHIALYEVVTLEK